MKQIYRYRAIIVIALALLCFGQSHAQQLPSGSEVNESFYQSMNHAFAPLEKNRVPHRLLRDFAFELVDLEDFNGTVTKAALSMMVAPDTMSHWGIPLILFITRISMLLYPGKATIPG